MPRTDFFCLFHSLDAHLFSWIEAGYGPAPNLAALQKYGKMREHFSRVKDGVLVAVQRRDAGRAEHETKYAIHKISPVGRPAYSAGPKQVTDLHRALRLSRNTEKCESIFLGSRTVSLSRSSGETLVVRSTKQSTQYIRFRPLGAQLIQLDRSRSRTSTEPFGSLELLNLRFVLYSADVFYFSKYFFIFLNVFSGYKKIFPLKNGIYCRKNFKGKG